MTDDLDPIRTALDWLTHIVKNGGILSPHDFEHVLTEVIPQATKQYNELLGVEVDADL